MIRVAQLQRRPGPSHFSMERIFSDVRACLPEDIECRAVINRHFSRGLLPRLKDAWAVRSLTDDVKHIVGDVHYLAWFLPGYQTVLTVHDCVSLERLEGARRWVFWFLWYNVPVRKVARITVVSEYTREQLLHWVKIPREKIDVIPPTCSEAFRWKEPRPFPQRPNILVVGTGKNKNVLRLVEACRGLDVHLSIIGQLTPQQSAALEAAQIPYSAKMGLSLEEVVEEYENCDLLAFVSTYEGFGMPIVEAQSVGRPVLTSNVCSMPEASGGAACIVDPFDVGSIRRGLERILGDPQYRLELVGRGRTHAKGFRPENVAARYAEVYRSMMASA